MRVRIIVKLLVIFMVFLLFTLSVRGLAQSSIQVKSGHPRLFITPSNLNALQTRAASTSLDTYNIIKTWCDTNWNNSSAQMSFFSSTNDHIYDDGALRYALIYILGDLSSINPSITYAHPINEYGDKAVSIILNFITTGDAYGWTGSMHYQTYAITYDWVNSRMTTSQKTTIVNWLKAIDSNFAAAGGGGITNYLTPGYHTYFMMGTPVGLYPSLAIYGDGIDDTYAQNHINFIPTYLSEARAISHESGHNGGNASGLGYGWTVFAGDAKFITFAWDLYALATATDLSFSGTFGQYPYPQNFPIWVLYGIQPGPPSPDPYTGTKGHTVTKWEDIGSWQWNITPDAYSLYNIFRAMVQVNKQLGDENKAQLITWLLNNRFNIPKQNITWDIVFNDRTTPATNPDSISGISRSKAFGWDTTNGKIDSYLDNPKVGQGHVYMKSSWSDNATTTHASFKVFPYLYTGHQHFDSLAFSIFKGEPLALANTGKYYTHFEGAEIDSPYGVGYPFYWHYYRRTAASNSLLIMDPSENIVDNGGHIYKDGGQRGNFSAGSWGSAVPDSSSDWGGLIKYEDTSDYTFSSGDATKGYNSVVNGINHVSSGASPKVSLVQRDFVYLKSSDGNKDYFVVFDRMDSTNPTFRKVFLLHTPGEPILNGTSSVVHGNATNGILQSDDTNTFTIIQNTSKLFMKTLFPSATKVYKIGGNVTTTLTTDIDATTGNTPGGPKINLPVASTALLPEKPSVLIDGEWFKCDGKTASSLTDCLRGKRLHSINVAHSAGATVSQAYRWTIREGDGSWIDWPTDYVGGFDSNVQPDCDEYGRWTIRVETTADETHSNFLHVLRPIVNMSETSITTSLITSASGNMRGAFIDDATTPRIVMFSPTTAQVSDVTYDASYLASQTGKHLITGFIPNSTYDLYKNGTKLFSKVASSQGIISFESTGGSTFRLVQTGGPVAPTSDITPPSISTNLTAAAISSSQINLSWSPSTDNVGVAGYRIYRNGSQIAISAPNFYSDSGLSPATTYSYNVGAYDAAGNVSGQSNTASGTTQASTDATFPVRSNGSPAGTLPAGTTQTTLSLKTNENATCKYSIAAGVSYFSMTNTFSNTGSTSHSTTVSGLSNGTPYNCYVRCMDASGNANPDDYIIAFSIASGTQPIQSPVTAGYVVNDFTFYPVPDIQKPSKGAAFQDPNFHTEIIRITDSTAEVPGAKYNYAQAGYPKHDIENADGTLLLIQSFSNTCWHIWNANPPYNKIRDIPSDLIGWCRASDFRWDTKDPDILYYEDSGKLWKYHVSSNTATLLHDFKIEFPPRVGEQYPLCGPTLQEEGDASDDRRYWAFSVYCYDPNHSPTWYTAAIVVYDKDFNGIDNGKIISTLKPNDSNWRGDPGYVTMSPSGKYVQSGDAHYTWPRDFSSVRSSRCTYGHADMGMSAEGREVLVCGAYYNPTGYQNLGQWVAMDDLETGEMTYLAPLDKGEGAYHISGNSHSKPGWSVISIYYPKYPGVVDNWAQHSVFMVELSKRVPNPTRDNHARVWRLAHTHTCLKAGYADAPFGKINRKGTKVWFGSSWSEVNSYIDGYPYDVYQINLPATWYEDLMGFSILNSSLAEGTVSSTYSQTLQATGGISPYNWNINSGSLPTGLTLNGATGVISGTPTTLGTFNFTIQASDASSPAKTATKALQIILPPAAPKRLRIGP